MRLERRPKYASLALAAMHRTLAYRSSTLISIATSLLWVTISYYVWQAVFAANPQVEGYTWDRMRTYILVAYGVNALLGFYTEARLFQLIRTGDVAVELLRPVDFLYAQMAQACGAAIVEGAIAVLSALALNLLGFHVGGPASSAVVLFPLSVTLGFVVKFLLSYLTALLCFRTTNAIGLLWARSAVTNILSGALIPLAFFPDWLRAFAQATPFPAIVATPLEIYLGDTCGDTVITAVALQAAWALVLWGVARLAWRASVRALTVQGG